MREITPYRTLDELRKTLDNGGRFYNLFTSAGDEVVTRAELAKAAGVYSAGVNAFLFLEMSQQGLNASDQRSVVHLLDEDLREEYQSNRPDTMAPSEVEEKGVAGGGVIVTGHARFVEDRTKITTYIMIPITVNNITTFSMMPIYDKFDVYEVFDDSSRSGPSAMVATGRGKEFGKEGAVRFGGVLRELKYKKGEEGRHKLYLDTVFYTNL